MLGLCARLYLPSLVAMALWVFVWPLAVSAGPAQPLLWRAALATLVVFLLALGARLLARARREAD